jgi:hypothetical protein
MADYNRDDLNAKWLGTWRDQDFALLNYPPRRWEAYAGVNDTTRLVIDFKEAVPAAVEVVTTMAIHAMTQMQEYVRDDLGCGYIVVAPTSRAGERNAGCETVAAALAKAFPFLVHLSQHLVRTTSVAQSHLGARHTVEDHVASIKYVGPPLVADLSSLYCARCAKPFRGESGFRWHLENIHNEEAGPPRSILLMDDVITRGTTGEACRQVLMTATGVPAVYGFYLAKTSGW